MKTKNLFLMAVIAMTPLMACNAGSANNNAAAEQVAPDASPSKPNHAFLKKAGFDVSKLAIIGDTYDTEAPIDDATEIIELEGEQLFKVLPPAQNMTEDAINGGGFDIRAAKALPGGYTLLIISSWSGDAPDSSQELMAIYDRNGKLTDLMRLGDINEFLVTDQNDEFTQGQAEATSTVIKFVPNGFTIDKTVKMGDWKCDTEVARPSQVTNVQWMVQTLETYGIDDKGHIAFKDRKELKREGNVKQDAQTVQLDNLSRLPMSDPTRIDQLNNLATRLLEELGDEAYEDEVAFGVQMVLGEYFESNPQALLQWIFNNRAKEDMIVPALQNNFANEYSSKSALGKALEQMSDKTAQRFLKELFD